MVVDTGGPLNKLNGLMGISAPEQSVPVMTLIRKHNPKSHDELYKLITDHAKHKCSCGIKSKGSVKDFGKKLFEAQKNIWGRYRFSLKQCIQWEYDLFIIQSMKATSLETKVKRNLNQRLNDSFGVNEVNEFVDDELRVDLNVTFNGNLVCGIQVKPASYQHVRKNVINFNANANKKFGKPVFYVFYEYESEKLINIDKISPQIKEMVIQ